MGKTTYALLLLLTTCVDPYPTPEIKPGTEYLVVDGFLNVTQRTITVRLTRSVALDMKENSKAESGATVLLEDSGGQAVPLQETGDGFYECGVNAQFDRQYRLAIELHSGKTYLSDFVDVKTSPAIDSISYRVTDFGLSFNTNSHDSRNETHYFMWSYDETWEYTSAFQSSYKLEKGIPVYRNEDIYHCWQTAQSRDILVGSTANLERDVVADFSLLVIPRRSVKLNEKYSLLVRQIAIDKEAYAYWQLLKKNTESLGGLFDPLPSQVTGNVHNERNANEIVLGYFSASTVTEKRLTLGLWDLPPVYRQLRDFSDCLLATVNVSQLADFNENVFLLVSPVPGFTTAYFYASTYCADCRKQGGTNARPDFM